MLSSSMQSIIAIETIEGISHLYLRLINSHIIKNILFYISIFHHQN